MIVTLVVAFLIMLAGNAVLSYSRASLFSTSSGTIAGALTVSSSPEGGQFTVFGSDALPVSTTVEKFRTPFSAVSRFRFFGD